MERGTATIFAAVLLLFSSITFLYSMHTEDGTLKLIPDTYKVEVVEYNYAFLGKSEVIVKQDGQKLDCEMPTRQEAENKTPMNCAAVPDTIKVG